ncbi:hypothetical protein WZ342_2577 [Enterococcus faecalis]|nr:hypothetical protein WZ342_2577 [Enterococcus faecalis]
MKIQKILQKKDQIKVSLKFILVKKKILLKMNPIKSKI